MAAARDCHSVGEARALDRRGAQRARLLARVYPELWVFAAAILFLNVHVLSGLRGFALEPQSFLASRVLEGEWWRLFTHPFVHVTGYHLLLDAGAFFLLYSGLEETRATRRLLNAACCCAGSLSLAVLTEPAIRELGLCGLSGVAHGLMASSALELALDHRASRSARFQAGVCFATVAAKSIAEVLAGRCFLECLGFGMLGTPVPACHLGGVLGGVFFGAVSRFHRAPLAASVTGRRESFPV